MTFQLTLVQRWTGTDTYAAYLGYRKFPLDHNAAFYLRMDIATALLVSLYSITDAWKRSILVRHQDFPVAESEWPLFLPSHEAIAVISPSEAVSACPQSPASPAPLSASIEGIQTGASPGSLGRLSQLTKTTLADYGFALNYWLSNFFARFGFDVCMLVHAIVAVSRMDVIGMTYFCFLGIWLYLGTFRSSRVWSAYIFGIGMAVLLQYVSAIGFPGLQVPWASLPRNVLDLLGLPLSPASLRVAPDVGLAFFCSLQTLQFQRERSPIRAFHLWVKYAATLDYDFTEKPRYDNF